MDSPGIRLIQVGFACNNHCLHCAQGDLHRTTSVPPVSEQLEQAQRDGVASVAFVGGEPTLHDELPDWIARASSFATTLLQTNGRRLAYSTYAEELARAGLTNVEISIGGPRAEIGAYHTRVEESWAQSSRGAQHARQAGLRTALTMLLTRSSYRHQNEAVTLASRLAVALLHLAFVRPYGAALERLASLVPRHALVRPYSTAAFALAESTGLPLIFSGIPLCQASGPVLDEQGGQYSEACTDCAARARCPGVDPIYAQHFGLDELMALDIAPPPVDAVHAELIAGIGVTR